MLVEHALAFDFLVGDGQQGIPVVGDLPLEAGADAAVLGFVDVVAGNVGIVDDGKNQILISTYTKPKKGSQQASAFIAQTSAKIYNLLRDKNGETPK